MHILNIIYHELCTILLQKDKVASIALYYLVMISLFPMTITTKSILLKISIPIIILVALTTCLMHLGKLFQQDINDGSFELYLLSSIKIPTLVALKTITHWIITGLPISILSPFLVHFFYIDLDITKNLLFLVLMINMTLVCTLIGSLGSSLSIGLSQKSMLIPIIIVPLYVPSLFLFNHLFLMIVDGTFSLVYLGYNSFLVCALIIIVSNINSYIIQQSI